VRLLPWLLVPCRNQHLSTDLINHLKHIHRSKQEAYVMVAG
jgi:hypothetical protein